MRSLNYYHDTIIIHAYRHLSYIGGFVLVTIYSMSTHFFSIRTATRTLKISEKIDTDLRIKFSDNDLLEMHEENVYNLF